MAGTGKARSSLELDRAFDIRLLVLLTLFRSAAGRGELLCAGGAGVLTHGSAHPFLRCIAPRCCTGGPTRRSTRHHRAEDGLLHFILDRRNGAEVRVNGPK